MTIKIYYLIEGQTLDPSQLELPANKQHRNFWTVDGNVVSVDWDAALTNARNKAELSRFDFAMAAAGAGFVTYAEAAQWAAGNTVPQAVQDIIDTLPAEQQGPVMVDVLARPTIRRMASLMPALAASFNTDDAGIDDLFGISVGP